MQRSPSGQGTPAPPSAEQHSFDQLLVRLGGDRDRGGEAYEAIRRRLIKFFQWRGCRRPDEGADETIDRVARRLSQGENIRSADPSGYFLGVARNVLRESWARDRHDAGGDLARVPEPFHDPRLDDDEQATEARLQCIERCLQHLPPESRRLVTAYYSGARNVDSRKELARELGIGMNALWIRMHRLRTRLEACARDCALRAGALPRGTVRGRA